LAYLYLSPFSPFTSNVYFSPDIQDIAVMIGSLGTTGGASMHADLEKSMSRAPSVPQELLAGKADAELLGKH